MGRIAKQFRRIKRRDVIAEEIIFPLKRRPRGVDDESRQSDKNEQWVNPPNVRAHGLAKCPLGHCNFCVWHKGKVSAWVARSTCNELKVNFRLYKNLLSGHFFMASAVCRYVRIDAVICWNHA